MSNCSEKALPKTVWTAHIEKKPEKFGLRPDERLLGVFNTEYEAALKVRNNQIIGFDDRGWVTEWNPATGKYVYNVVVFDKGQIAR